MELVLTIIDATMRQGKGVIGIGQFIGSRYVYLVVGLRLDPANVKLSHPLLLKLRLGSLQFPFQLPIPLHKLLDLICVHRIAYSISFIIPPSVLRLILQVAVFGFVSFLLLGTNLLVVVAEIGELLLNMAHHRCTLC